MRLELERAELRVILHARDHIVAAPGKLDRCAIVEPAAGSGNHDRRHARSPPLVSFETASTAARATSSSCAPWPPLAATNDLSVTFDRHAAGEDDGPAVEAVCDAEEVAAWLRDLSDDAGREARRDGGVGLVLSKRDTRQRRTVHSCLRYHRSGDVDDRDRAGRTDLPRAGHAGGDPGRSPLSGRGSLW